MVGVFLLFPTLSENSCSSLWWKPWRLRSLIELALYLLLWLSFVMWWFTLKQCTAPTEITLSVPLGFCDKLWSGRSIWVEDRIWVAFEKRRCKAAWAEMKHSKSCLHPVCLLFCLSLLAGALRTGGWGCYKAELLQLLSQEFLIIKWSDIYKRVRCCWYPHS